MLTTKLSNSFRDLNPIYPFFGFDCLRFVASLQGRGGDPPQWLPHSQGGPATDGVPGEVHDGGFPHHAVLHHRHPVRQAGETQGRINYLYRSLVKLGQAFLSILVQLPKICPYQLWDIL